MTYEKGDIILKRYRVEAGPFRGGMAEVYKVWDELRSSYLALKLLREDLSQDPVFIRRFRREGKTLERLSHPNIVRFYGMEQDDLQVFFLMEWVEGSSLRTEIFRTHGKGGMEPSRVLEVMQPVCSALHYAHNLGIAHADIKPGNILIDKNGRVFLTDFGISRMTEGATATLVGAGTPAYMAPELIWGGNPSPQSDIYALGLVMYEMVTGGERPFTGENAKTTGSTAEKVRWEQLNKMPPSPRKFNKSISPEMEAVILQCLEKDPAKRFNSTKELLTSLQAILSGEKNPEGIQNFPQAALPLARQPRIRKWLPFIITAGGALAIGGVLLLLQKGTNLHSSVQQTQTLTSVVIPSSTPTPFFTPTFEATITPTITPTVVPTLFGGGTSGKIAFVTGGSYCPHIHCISAELLTIPATGGSPTLFRAAKDYGQFDISATWSPDGKKAVLGIGYKCVIIDKDGKNEIKVSFPSESWAAQWSPDSQKIAIQHYEYLHSEVYVVNADGTSLINLSQSNYDDRGIIWSPDSTKILFTSNRLSMDQIYLVNVDGSGLINLSNNLYSESASSWSSIDNRILYYSNRPGNGSYYSMDEKGSNVKEATPSEISSFTYNEKISPDGKKLIAGCEKQGSRDYCIFNLDKSNSIQIPSIDNQVVDASSIENYSWSPNSTYIVFTITTSENEQIYTINSSGTDLKKIYEVDKRISDLVWLP